MILHVRVDDECGERIILLFIYLVLDNGEDVETRENGVRQVYVVNEVQSVVVGTFQGVGSSYHCAAGLQGGNDACLRD